MGLVPVFLVFPACSVAAADVALCLVLLEDFLHLCVERPVNAFEPLGQVLVNRRFGDGKMLGCVADGCAALDELHSKLPCSPFQIISHVGHLQGCVCASATGSI